MSERQVLSGILRPVGLVVLVLVVVALTLFGAATGFSNSRARRLNDAWAVQFGTLEQVLERYPPRDSNAAALELETLVARLGINIAPRGMREPAIADADEDAWREAYGDVQDYVSEQLERTDGPPEAPPPTLHAWLTTYRGEFDAVVAALTEGAPPRWMLHLEDLHEAQLPNLLGHIQLQKLLAADALLRVHEGNHGLAAERLDAAWRLHESLADDPILISQLIALFGLELQTATLRHVEASPAIWHARLRDAKPRERLTLALEFEAWHWTQLDQPLNAAPISTFQKTVLGFVAPYVRLCAADTSARMRVKLDRLKRLDYLCDRDFGRAGADLVVEPPAWNRLGDLGVPNLMDSIVRAARAEIDLELTARVLDLRAARAASGRWPTDDPRLEASAACPDDRWEYAVGVDGSAQLAFSRELRWPRQPGIDYPSRFELSLR